jgi:hypothetical protein
MERNCQWGKMLGIAIHNSPSGTFRLLPESGKPPLKKRGFPESFPEAGMADSGGLETVKSEHPDPPPPVC